MPVSEALDPREGLLHAFVLDGRGGGRGLDWQGVRAHDGRGILWINLDYSAPESLAWLDGAGLEPRVRAALTENDPRPEATCVGDGLLLVVRGLNVAAGADADMVSMRAWITADRIVTLRRRPMNIVRTLATELAAGSGPRSVGAFTVALIERVMPPIIKEVSELDDRVAAGEEDLLDGNHAADLRTRLSAIRRRAISLRRFVGPQREALEALAQATPSWLGDAERSALSLAASRLTRTVEELDALRDRAAVATEEIGSRTDEIAGRRLYVLSIMTALFLPLGFVCGLLGVNIGGVPFTQEARAFPVLVGLFGVLVLGQIWLFRRRGWF